MIAEIFGQSGMFLLSVDIRGNFSYNKVATHLQNKATMVYIFIGKNVRSVFATIVV